MDDTTQQRIEWIKNLAREYFLLSHGALIKKHIELLKVFDIPVFDSAIAHPHNGMGVYFSRRALKHFIERRTVELEKKHTPQETLAKIEFALEVIPEVILKYHQYTREREEGESVEKHFYSRDYSTQGEPAVRILVEERDGNLEIRSLHFTKVKLRKDTGK